MSNTVKVIRIKFCLSNILIPLQGILYDRNHEYAHNHPVSIYASDIYKMIF